MKNAILLTVLLLVIGPRMAMAQTNRLSRLDFLIGDWTGSGQGYNMHTANVNASFHYIMRGKFIEVITESHFPPAGNIKKGEFYQEHGFFSYDEDRKLIIYHQFNSQGYINRYFLNDTLSTSHTLVFDTEATENFIPGGKARWIIQRKGNNNVNTSFDVAYPGLDYISFGTEQLKKVPPAK